MSLNGDVKIFSEEGVLEKTIPYKFGRNTGAEITYYPNKKKHTETKLLDGQKSGRYYEYYENGKVKVKGNHLYDVRQGNWEYYDTSEKLIKTENYSRGRLMSSSEN